MKPTPAIQVRSDTEISECVAIMNERNVGSVLVYSHEDPSRLIGIFTERDLLRNMELIHTGGYWSFPVSSVMTRPVITISPENLNHAASVMLGHGFRHLPIVEALPDGGTKLHGVISIRDVLKALKIREVWLEEPTEQKKVLSVAVKTRSKDPKFDASIMRLLRKLATYARFVDENDSAEEETSQSLVVVDADGMSPPDIAELVRAQLTQDEVQAIFVFHTSGTIPAVALKALEELRSTRKLELFLKPLNLLALSDALSRMRVGRKQ